MIDLTKLFDSYNRVARLYPALLVLAPLVWTAGVFHPSLISGGISKLIVTSIVSIGGLVLLSNLSRSYGKSLEDKLIKSWGGWRTTILLRHRDPTIDSFTKSRYHKKLGSLLESNFELPTAEEETVDPQGADHKYRSATKQLIEHRRDKKYNLIHNELAAYGFRRNLRGMKWLGIAVLIVALIINFAAWIYTAPSSIKTISALIEDVAHRWDIYVLSLVNLGCLLIWILCITETFVLRSADEYAHALFRTLEKSA